MKISFNGACREVTGSCAIVETDQIKFLVDCGMFQGRDFASRKNHEPFHFNPADINFVLLTHAHMDHCGRLPKLYKEGFRGKIYATAPTMDLTRIILDDSAKVILREAQKQNRRPFYTGTDVNGVMAQFDTVSYEQEKKVSPEVKVRFRDAGHILGSAVIEVWLEGKKLVFSGDLGNPPAPIIRDTEFIDFADYVIMESTYGGRTHESKGERLKLLKKAIIGSVGRGGSLMIPAFALERTQEVLYELNGLVENKKIPPVPIFVDSPLAILATEVYKKYVKDYDQESRTLIESGDDLFNFPGLVYTRTSSQSKTINTTPPPKVILAGSGMITGGRMPFHLKFNLGDPKSHLLFISYQVKGSLGRKLFDGAKSVMVDGHRLKVRAKVSAIGSYSSHADQPKLLNWAKMIKNKPEKVFVVHGELESNQALADSLKQKLKLKSIIPEIYKTYEL